MKNEAERSGMEKTMKKVSVIIPAYNESRGIGQTLQELTENVDLEETEIIVVNDGSTDNTADIVSGFPQVRLISHKKNKGYGTAIRTGVRNAQGEIVVWYDSDGQHRPEDLHRVVKEMVDHNLDYCIGVRSEGSHVEKTRVLGKMILRLILWIFTRQKIMDFNSGLRAFKRSILIRYLGLLPRRFGASTVTTILMQEEDYTGGEVPIVTRKRVGKSSVRQFRDGFRTIGLILNVILLFHPLRLYGSLGGILAVSGLFYGILRALMWHKGIPVLAAVMILCGAQLFCFGLLSHQINSVRYAIGRDDR